MADLTKKEIIAELRKVGVNSTAEIDIYYREYREYSARYSQAYFTKSLQRIRKQLFQRRNVHSRNTSEAAIPIKLKKNS